VILPANFVLVINSKLTCGTAGIQSGTANALNEKLPAPVATSESSASDQRDSGVVRCLFFFVENNQ